MIAFTILGEPASKANQRQLVKFGNRPALIKSKKACDYEAAALLQIPALARQRLEGPCRLTIRFYYASERPDLDASVVEDCLQDRYIKAGGQRVLAQAGVVKNDRQFREKHFYWALDRRRPRAEIAVEPMTMQQPELPVPQPDPF